MSPHVFFAFMFNKTYFLLYELFLSLCIPGLTSTIVTKNCHDAVNFTNAEHRFGASVAESLPTLTLNDNSFCEVLQYCKMAMAPQNKMVLV